MMMASVWVVVFFFTHHSLEAGVQLREEGWFVSLSQDSFLHHRALNVIILNHNIFLQDLDGVQLLCGLHLCQHYLQSTGRRS